MSDINETTSLSEENLTALDAPVEGSGSTEAAPAQDAAVAEASAPEDAPAADAGADAEGAVEEGDDPTQEESNQDGPADGAVDAEHDAPVEETTLPDIEQFASPPLDDAPVQEESPADDRATTHIMAGTDTWEPTASDLQSIQSTFQTTEQLAAETSVEDGTEAAQENDVVEDAQAESEAEASEIDRSDAADVTIVRRFVTNVLKVQPANDNELEVSGAQLAAFKSHMAYVYSVPAYQAEAAVQHIDLLPTEAQAAIYNGSIPDLDE